ncbi:OmpA family protein [Alcanivorax sp. 1008]|uniref:OmpA family protein n=1 Tax=Alcanivorax sp. 1008 TaxID=2816853 RepID=UPI001D885DDB|nr:OmpA family protein [Alcanivorax sp. 1008]MCC1496381.1 OmpA family protein [Alcanivorax sp. 1008]
MKRSFILSEKTPLAFASGVFVAVWLALSLPRLKGWQRQSMPCVALLLLLLSGFSSAALVVTQPPAELSWSGSVVPATANVEVLRYESIGLYRYDPGAPDSYQVWQGNFASPDSLSGTPSLLGALPAPIDDAGTPLPLNSSIPLAPSDFYEGREPIFIVANTPILPPTAIATRPDGRRFIGVTIDISSGDSYTIALVETATNSNVYVGYLQPNIPGSPIVIPPDSTVEIRYDNNGDVADSLTAGAPWFVDPLVLGSIQAERRSTTSAAPLPDTDLFVTKTSQRGAVMTGDFLAYDVNVENISIAPALSTQVIDSLPAGFRYQPGSLRIDGIAVADPAIDPSGSQLTIDVGNIAPGASRTVRYVTEVTVAARAGRAANLAQATAGIMRSNMAKAEVLVERPFFNDRAFLMGRVIAGSCGEQDAPGLEGVRIYMEDGTSVITDKHGRWHIEGVTPGTHVLQLDTITLGPRHTLSQCHDNTRQAGNPSSRFVNVQGGTLWRENWYINVRPALDAQLQQQLTTRLEDGVARITLPIGNGETLFTNVTTHLFLPHTLTPVPGSIRFDGKPISDPIKRDNFYEFQFPVEGYFWRHTLEMDLAVDPNTRDTVEQSILFNTFGTTPDNKRFSVSSQNSVRVTGAQMKDNELVLRPRFASMSAGLSERDRLDISNAADTLRGKPGLRLEVYGHTDSQRIVPRAGRVINDNYALSEARARAVAGYLSELLLIPLEQITIVGKGPDEPVADNDTADGRALNRRVTVRFFTQQQVSNATLATVVADSGLNRDRASERNDSADAEAKKGFLNLTDGMMVIHPVVSVTARLDDRLTPKLLLDGVEVSDARIGSRIADEATKTVVYTWVGVEIDSVGEHNFELQGKGGFGVVRFREKVTLRRSGELKSIRSGDSIENVADGLTPVQLKLNLFDAFDQPLQAQTELRIVSGSLRPLNYSQTTSPLEDRGDVVVVDQNGIARFAPVSTAGTYRLRLTDGRVVSDELTVAVSPDLREWILVGFAEGTVGYNTLSGNMQNLGSPDKHAYVDGEMAFFARGTVAGEWLLTAALDTRRVPEGRPLNQAIDPQRWYVLYGDDAQRTHDAPSSKKLYVRMEKRDFYALFGDYDTGLTVTELGRYQRVLTGAKAEWRGRNVSALGFVADSSQGFIRDDIEPDGTSGLYRLSRAPIVPGSETVTVEVRDRFTNEVISSTPMTRFIDYSLDSADGTMFFRQPIPVQDASFNPLSIVVTYEVEVGAEKTVAGGRATVFNEDESLTVGITAVNDDTLAAPGSLIGADVVWKPTEQHTIKAELAGTRQDLQPGSSNDQAWLLEHQYTSEQVDTRVRIDQTDDGFGLTQQSPSDEDSRNIQAGIRYRINEDVAVSADASRQQVPDTGNRRDLVEGRVEYQQPDWQAFAGARHVESVTNGGIFESQQLIAGGQKDLLDKRLTLSATGETSINSGSDESDYPSRLMLGSDYRLTDRVSLFANQEFTWSHEQRTQDSRVGARATPWRGATASTSVSRSMDEYGPRMMAHAGLFQTIELSQYWTADIGFDRAQTLVDGNPVDSFDPDRAPASGTDGNDYTAISGGLGYQDASWQWTNRVEYRHAVNDDKWNLLSGFQHRLDETNTVAGRALHFDQKFRTGDILRSSELDFSYVRRPLSESWFWLNRSRVVYDEQRDAFGSRYGHRLINNTHLNFVAQERHQVSLQYGARYVGDTIDSQRFTGYTDLIGGEYRYDITPRWDVGVRGSTLASYNSNVRMNSFGLMAGYSPIRDVWISLGYNFRGFYDDDFSGAQGRVQGIVLDFRIKFDQSSAKRFKNSVTETE